MRQNKKCELGELLEYEQPTKYIVKSTDYDASYRIPVLTAGKSFILGYTNEDKNVFDKLPVIVFDDFTTAIQYVDFKFKVKSSAMKILNINTKLVLPKYIYYRMQIIVFDHSTHKRYWIQEYSKIKISVPPLPEQEKIVAQIEELFSQLDKSVDTLKNIKRQLVVYRQSVLKEAFEGKWKFKERTGIPTTVYFKNVNENELLALKKLPSEWKYVYLSDLGDLSRGRSKHRPRNDTRLFENGKYPFFQTGDVKSAKKELFESEKLYGDFGLQQSRLWPAGTLCITIAANIAETCFLGVDGCFPDSIVGFTPNSKLVDKNYVRFFIEASKLRLWAFAPATAQKNINLATLENLIIPYCTLEEQHYIVQEIESRLSVCDSIEKTIDDILKQTDVMRKSILNDAFERRL